MTQPIYIVPLPMSVRDRLDENTHPGLLLDKYAPSWSNDLPAEKLSAAVQRPTVDEVVRLSQSPPAGANFDGLISQRQFTLKSIQALTLKATTTGPLTLHLSRSSSLENAGICLHRIYGFTYLPGTGIKGLTRAFAETVWLPAQPDQNAAWRQIEDVFGWAPNRDRQQMLKEHPDRIRHRELAPLTDSSGKPLEQRESMGRVVFHDAWPLKWPKLQTDILNSHHQKYYSAQGVEVPPPGDWEEPIPVYFLAVVPNTPFEFAVSARRADDQHLTQLAAQWLAGALEHSGAGAKTNAGYGSFRLDSTVAPAIHQSSQTTWAASEQAGHRLERSFTLTLATPAFLAGANPEDPSSCDLRVSTLRGQLRSSWRTLHAAHLSPADLKRLESAIWGDTKRGGAVRVTLSRPANAPPLQPKSFDRRGIIAANKLPEPPNKKTTQGLTYVSYGMDEVKDGRPSRRPYLEPGSSWTVTFTIRPGKFVQREKSDTQLELSQPLTVDQLGREAFAALDLLCQLGAVGSKSRKGFGSFRLPPELPAGPLSQRLPGILEQSKALRNELGLKPGRCESPALEHLLAVEAVQTPWTNYWVALDRLGDAAQAFAQSKKHILDKKALGLPRNVRAPYSGSFQPHKEIKDRHASPIQFHLTPGADGRYVASLVAFPADRLPTFDKSKAFLTDALQQIRLQLVERTKNFAAIGLSAATGSRTAQATPPPASGPKLPSPGDRVACKLSSEKTKSGGWKATYGKLIGPIQNSQDVPSDKQPGEEVTLIVRISKPTEIAFRWPTAADEKPTVKPPTRR